MKPIQQWRSIRSAVVCSLLMSSFGILSCKNDESGKDSDLPRDANQKFDTYSCDEDSAKSPGSSASLSEKLRKISSLRLSKREKQIRRIELIHELAERSGYHASIELINELVPSGFDRRPLIQAMFSGLADSPTELLKYARHLDEGEEEFAVIGIFDGLVKKGLPLEQTLELLRGVGGASRNGVEVGAWVFLVNANNPKEVQNFLMVVNSLGNESSDLRNQLLLTSSNLHGFDTFEAVQKTFSSEQLQAADLRKILNSSISAMISENPVKAIEILATDSPSSTSLFVGVDYWIESNSSEALDWFAEKKIIF